MTGIDDPYEAPTAGNFCCCVMSFLFFCCPFLISFLFRFKLNMKLKSQLFVLIAEMVIDTEKTPVADAVELIVSYLYKEELLEKPKTE